MKTIKKTINGIEYTAVYRGMKVCNEILHLCVADEKTGRLAHEKLANAVFNEVITSPKVNIDDFENLESYDKVIRFGKSILTGDFEEHKSKSQLQREVEQEWDGWRLVFNDISNFTYEEVFYEMTPQEIAKANIALNIVNEQLQKQMKSK